MMRVAVVVRTFPTLSETFVLNQVTGLIDRGCDVTVLARDAGEAHPEFEQYGLRDKTVYHERLSLRHPVTAIRALKYGAHGRRVLQAYGAASKLEPFDVIHCHFGPLGLLAVRLRELGGIQGRIVTTFHGFDITAAVQEKGEGVYAELFEKGDLFLPISELWHRRLIELGCPAERIAVHRMGIDLERFRFGACDIGTPLELVSVTRLTHKKGLEYSIRAVAALCAEGRNVHYRIAGDGPLRPELEALIQELGVAGKVELLGAIDQDAAAALLASADVLLAPSVTAPNGDMEGIPVALMEAMATGLPVVTTRHSGIPELVTHNVSGYLAAEHDVDGLADGIRTICDNPAIASEWAEAARRTVQERHDIEGLNDQLLERFRHAAGDAAHERRSASGHA